MESTVRILRIAYCEDETAQAEYVSDMIKNWGARKNTACDVDLYGSAEEFLFEMDEAELFAYDLILLDISMQGMNGFSLAERIRSTDKKVRLAFITSDADFVFRGYEVEAFRYIMKPVTQGKLDELLNSVSAQGGMAMAEYVILEVSGQKRKIDKSDILYVEVDGHYTTIHCESGEFTVKDSFKDVLAMLNAGDNTRGADGNTDSADKTGSNLNIFCRCHRSAAVNIDKVTRIGRELCRLKGGQELAVSRGMYEELNRAFIRHNMKH